MRSRWTTLRSPTEIDRIDRAASIAMHALRAGCLEVALGVTPRAVSEVVHRSVVSQGGTPAFIGYRAPEKTPFPAAACVCVNQVAAHGVPGDLPFRDGDLVTVDVGVECDGFFADVAETVVVGTGEVPRRLARATRSVLATALRALAPGVRWSRVARAIRARAAYHDLAAIDGYAGHGVGRSLHEPPVASPDARPGVGTDFLLVPGMVLTVEPLLASPGVSLVDNPDGWSMQTSDGSVAAYCERTVAITRRGARVLGLRASGPG